MHGSTHASLLNERWVTLNFTGEVTSYLISSPDQTVRGWHTGAKPEAMLNTGSFMPKSSRSAKLVFAICIVMEPLKSLTLSRARVLPMRPSKGKTGADGANFRSAGLSANICQPSGCVCIQPRSCSAQKFQGVFRARGWRKRAAGHGAPLLPRARLALCGRHLPSACEQWCPFHKAQAPRLGPTGCFVIRKALVA